MSKPRVLVANTEIPQDALDLLTETCELIVASQTSRQDILAKVSGVDAILWCSKEKLDMEVIEKAGPNLKVVATMSAGYDQIDAQELKKRNIKFGNTPNVLNASVAEIALLLILAAAHRQHEGRLVIEQDKWESYRPQWMLGQDLQGSTVGIVGFGGIGQAIAKRLIPFDVAQIIYTGHRPKPEANNLGAKYVSFEELLQKSDFIVISCPLTKETHMMFNEPVFKKMKSNSILVNVARGDIVDQNALIKALEKKWIYGAGLDVTTPEPLPTNSPLLKFPNCVLLPHLGSATIKTRTAMAVLAAQNIIAGLKGKPMPAQV